MIRFLLRFVGLLLLALAFIFFVYDGTKSIANQTMLLTSLSDGWNLLFSKSPEEVILPILDTLSATKWLWDSLIRPVLGAPAALVMVILGSILVLLGRKKRPLIGYARH